MGLYGIKSLCLCRHLLAHWSAFFLSASSAVNLLFFLSKRPLVQYIDRTQIGVHFDSLA